MTLRPLKEKMIKIHEQLVNQSLMMHAGKSLSCNAQRLIQCDRLRGLQLFKGDAMNNI